MSDIRFNRWLHQSGTGGVYQDSSGRVGIGTSVPTTALDVQSGSIKIGSNTLSSSGVSTFTTVNATTVNATSLVGVTTAGITTAYIGSVNDGPISGFRNLITNGEMVLDQRNSGSSVTINSDGFGGRLFPVDRFPVQRAGTIVITAQQDTVAPPNFQNSVKLTVTTADSSVAATDYAFINHRLEGYTASPLRYGTSAAKQATLSFWVRSSVTGTYCIGISNYADNRAHVKEYTINSADTWEYKTITITGDTTGTWEKTNSGGMNISWTLLAGSDYQATANTWHTSVKLATSNQTQWGSTSSATFYLTGVQLELGTVATPFERRSYGQELALAQRYYEKGIIGVNGLAAQYSANVYTGSNPGFGCVAIPFAVTKRAIPDVPTVTANAYWVVAGSFAVSALADHTFISSNNTANCARFVSNRIVGNSAPDAGRIYMWEGGFTWTASAEL